MTDRRALAANTLAAYAIEIALGRTDPAKPTTFVYQLHDGSVCMAHVVPEAIHTALCFASPGAILLSDIDTELNVCDACRLAYKREL